MSGWREDANTRRDFRHTHDAPEVAKSKGARKRKPWHVFCSIGDGCGSLTGEFRFGKYATEHQAKQAVTAKSLDKFYHSFRIERI